MSCKYAILTENGVNKIVNDKNFANPVLQIIDYQDQKKQIGQDLLYCSEISDGYAKLRCYFCNDLLKRIEENAKKLNHQIIILKKYGATSKSILIYDFEVAVEEYQEIIGSPVPYRDFLAEGNPTSNNLIRPEKITTKLLASSKKAIVPVDSGTSKKKIELGDPNSFDLIADLYPDMQNWRIYCRVNKVNYSEFQAKSGNHTKLLAMELMDRKGATIRATIFGDYAEKMSKTIQDGDTYAFSKGLVKMDNYKKKSSAFAGSEYTIIFSEQSKILATTDDNSIQNSSTIYLTVNDLKLKEENMEVDVVGIIKEIKNATDIPAKSGNKVLKKRTVLICDPINKVEIDAVFWNELTDVDQGLLYKTVLLSEFKVHVYNGSLSINSSFRSKITELKDHPMNQYESKVATDSYETISYRRDENNTKTIRNVKEIEHAKENLTEDGSIWSDLRVYLNRIKDKAKKTYDGCPFCKKTVQPDDNICGNCSKNFPKAQTRYILTIELSDYSGSIWTTAHDDFAERIFKTVGHYPAQIVKGYSEKQFEDLAKSSLYQEFKVKVVSKYENSTDGQRRIKHNVVKLFPLDCTMEARNNLEYIRKRI